MKGNRRHEGEDIGSGIEENSLILQCVWLACCAAKSEESSSKPFRGSEILFQTLPSLTSRINSQL